MWLLERDERGREAGRRFKRVGFFVCGFKKYVVDVKEGTTG